MLLLPCVFSEIFQFIKTAFLEFHYNYFSAIAGPKLDKSKVNTPLSNKTFQQCKFVVKFFEKETAEQVKSLIQEFNGKVINQESRADYVIVPLTYEKKRRVGKKEVRYHGCLYLLPSFFLWLLFIYRMYTFNM